MPASGGSASDTNAPTNKVVDGQSHHLAYITPNEADKLVALGGKETITNEGIPAYPEFDSYTESSLAGTSSAGSGMSRSEFESGGNDNQGSGNQGSDQGHSRFEPDSGYYGKTSGNTVSAEDLHIANTGRDLDGNIVDQEEVDAASQRVTAGTNRNQRQDLTFQQHWANAPDAIKFSPTLRFLYASGKNIGDFFGKPGTYTAARDKEGYEGGDSESQMMRDLAPYAPYVVSGTTKPTNSPAANWFASSLGNTSLSGSNFSMATEYAAAKAKQQSILGSPSSVGQMAVNNSPFYNWLNDRSLNKGIL